MKRYSFWSYAFSVTGAIVIGAGSLYLVQAWLGGAGEKLAANFKFLPDSFQVASVQMAGEQTPAPVRRSGASFAAAMALAGSADRSLVKTAAYATDTETVIGFVGDIMLDRGVEQSVEKNAGGDYNYAFADLAKLDDADILFGNLEGPVSDQGRDRGNSYSFRMSPRVVSVLSAQGFDVLSIANNHMADWGREAFTDTLGKFATSGIALVGGGKNTTEAARPQVIETRGQKFCFLGFSDVGPAGLLAGSTTAGVLPAGKVNMVKSITSAKRGCDVVVASFHFGNEYQKLPTARQRDLARAAIDSGASIVVGTHPHVVQPIEEYNGGLIMYSLGNFVFDQYFSTSTMQGLAVKVHFKGKEIGEVEKLNTQIDNKYRVSVE